MEYTKFKNVRHLGISPYTWACGVTCSLAASRLDMLLVIYSTSPKKVKVPGDWFARGALAVRSGFGRGSVGERGTVRFSSVQYGARVINLQLLHVNVSARARALSLETRPPPSVPYAIARADN